MAVGADAKGDKKKSKKKKGGEEEDDDDMAVSRSEEDDEGTTETSDFEEEGEGGDKQRSRMAAGARTTERFKRVRYSEKFGRATQDEDDDEDDDHHGRWVGDGGRGRLGPQAMASAS